MQRVFAFSTHLNRRQNFKQNHMQGSDQRKLDQLLHAAACQIRSSCSPQMRDSRISLCIYVRTRTICFITQDGVRTRRDSFWIHSSAFFIRRPGSVVGIATAYELDGPGIECRFERDFPPVQTGPGAHPASCKIGTVSFPGVKFGRGVLLTVHPLLVPRSWKSRAIPLPTLWDFTFYFFIHEAGDGLLFGHHKTFTDCFEIQYSIPEQEVVGQFQMLIIIIRNKA
jgi:hypothetical protein